MSTGPTSVVCPACRKKLQVPLSAAGKTVQCPECDEDIPIPQSVPVAIPVTTAPPPAAATVGPNPFDFDEDASSEAAGSEESAAVPYFTVIEARNWSANRTYRVFVRQKQRELVAIYGGPAADTVVLGAFSDDPGKRRAKGRAAKEAKSLDEWRNAHPFNFSLRVKDIEEAEIVKPSFWFAINHSAVPQIGLLNLITAEGNWRLVISAVEDMGRALELLPPFLGDRLDVGIVWDKSRRRYVRA